MPIRLTAAFALASVLCHAQDGRKYSAFTSPVANGRFEVVQSSLVARETFKLDRYTGRVWQLVEAENKDYIWEQMTVQELPSIASPTTPRFQLFLSGIVVRNTFLLDTVTGKTWVETSITNEKGDELYVAWVPISNPKAK